MKFNTLKTKRFVIKNFSKKLINKKYLNWFSQEVIRKYIKFRPKSIEELKKNISIILTNKKNLFLSIMFKNKHIGNIKIHNINYKTKLAWLGILIGEKKYRGIGAAKEIIEEIKSFLSSKNFFFIKLNVSKKNKRAINTYVNSRFIIEKKFTNHLRMSSNIYAKKIILGLAQLQSNYGVTNTSRKKITLNESIRILKFLNNCEINELDSAYTYPFKNELLAKINKPILFNTKISTTDFQNLNKFYSSIKKLKKINNIKINTIFVHDGNNIINKNGQKLFGILNSLKKKKLIKKIGISFHDFSNFKNILNKFKVDTIQIPYSVVDQRARRYFKFIKKKNIEIQVRSVFLQGALLKKVKTNKKLSSLYDKIALKKNIDRVNFLLSFVLNETAIDKVVIGVRMFNELKIICNYFQFNKSESFYTNLRSNDPDVVNPLRWRELIYHEKK